MRSLHQVGTTTLSACIVLLMLTGCGDDTVTADPGDTALTSPAGSAIPTAPGICPQVVPDAVIEGLGWAPGDGAVEGRGGCTWSGPPGTITVFRSANTFTRACDLLRAAAPQDTYQDDVDNPGGFRACGYQRATDLGQSELALDVDTGSISISVASIEPTPAADVEDALATLTSTAADAP